ncbi:MAG: L,D-transpeptidase family protein [Cyanobacteria bacterium REEB65]|nr:L,D-transpeptidase family protein [Cyanobacteria bacterium REEB65]
MKCPNHFCEAPVEETADSCPQCAIPLVGAVLEDRFSLEKIVRASGNAITYLARDRQRLDDVQVRVFVPQFGRSVRNLKSEIKALKELQFDQLPRIYQFDWDAEFPWLAEGQPSGSSLGDRLLRGEALAEFEVVNVLKGVATILEKLHTLHVIHRDVRPETVFSRETDGRFMLAMPGWDRELQARPGRTKPAYAAPEALSGHATAQTDLYSLGVLAIHLLTGHNPEAFYKPTRHRFEWSEAARASPRLIEIVDSLVAESPSGRIQSAGRLQQLLAGLSGRPKEDDAALPPVAATSEPPIPEGPQGMPADEATEPPPGPEDAVEGDSRPPVEPKRETKRRLTILGLAAAMIAALMAFLRSLASRVPAQVASQGMRILVAIGLAVGAGSLARVLLLHHRPSDFPKVIVGRDDDQAVPAQPFAALALLPKWVLPKPVERALGIGEGPKPGKASGEASLPPSFPPAATTAATLARQGQPSLEGQDPGQPGSGSAGVSPGLAPAAEGPAQGSPRNSPDPTQSGAASGDAAAVPAGAGGRAPASGQEQYVIRINTTYHTLTLYQDGRFVKQFEVTTGKGASTPQGRFYVTSKVRDPSYGTIPGGDPRNPLGSHWLGLDVSYPGGKGIGIHGTNDPQALGMSESGGCIRLRNQDIDELYRMVPPGTPVEIF